METKIKIAAAVNGPHQLLEPIVDRLTSMPGSLADEIEYGTTDKTNWVKMSMSTIMGEEIQRLFDLVAADQGIETGEIFNFRTHGRRVNFARAVLFYIIRERYKLTWAKILKIFGSTSQTSGRNAWRKIAKLNIFAGEGDLAVIYFKIKNAHERAIAKENRRAWK
jgi:hypothetical protein